VITRAPLAIFARAPRAGRTKTRLEPQLGAEGAARLYAAFLEDVVAGCAAVPEIEAEIWAASPEDHEDDTLRSLAAQHRLDRHVQPHADLGARMAAALDAAIAKRGRGLVLGTDAPTLPRAWLTAAARALDEADVVLGPSADGGYWTVGARAGVTPAALFAGVRWSVPTTLAETLANVARLGHRAALLSPWYDVDTPDDLRTLRAHLALDRAAAPATARALGF
jgi:rSAM/selenodomain-associated transferase 1